MSILETDRLSVRLGETQALEAVTTRFKAGRITAVLGPNGAGKSTLLACLAGLRTPDSGTVLLDGAPLAALDRQRRAQRIGLLPQNGDVHWDIDVETLVGLGRFPHRGRWRGRAADDAAIAAALAATDLAALARRTVNSLSGGERSRALLARVLAGEPDWLLADEPLASLDPAHQLDVLARLRSVAKAGAGVVLVLHDLNQALLAADDVVLLKAGRVVAQGSTATVLSAATLGETYGIEARIVELESGRRIIATSAISNEG